MSPVYQPPASSGGGSVATDVIWDAAGDLAVGTGADTAARVALGASGSVLGSDGSTAAWTVPNGATVDYVTFTTDVAVSATTAATATTIVTGAGWTPNGSDSFWIEFFCPAVNPASSTGAALIFCLYDNGSIIASGAGSEGRIAQVTNPAASTLIVPVCSRFKVTPSNAAHAYSIRCYRVTGNGTVFGTIAGTGAPGFISITKAG